MGYVAKINMNGNNNSIASTLFGECYSAASDETKVVVCPEFDNFVTGVTIHIKFHNTNTAKNVYLNINSTGKIAVTTNGATWKAGSTLAFTYDGNKWILNSTDKPTATKLDANSTDDEFPTAKLVWDTMQSVFVHGDSDGQFSGISHNLANCSTEQIKYVTQSGMGQNIWDVGDKTAPIELNGKCGLLNFDHDARFCAFIIGFNHNMVVESAGKPSIHFQFGKTVDTNVPIAFCDEYYGQNQNAETFSMNPGTNINAGGWRNCYMRTAVCVEFFNCLPKEWQDIITPCTKYTDNTANGSGTSPNTSNQQSTTLDKIFLLSLYESDGEQNFWSAGVANYEYQYQMRYSYYDLTNSMRKYKHENQSDPCYVWLRTPYHANTNAFYAIQDIINRTTGVSRCSYGFAPAFMVA